MKIISYGVVKLFAFLITIQLAISSAHSAECESVFAHPQPSAWVRLATLIRQQSELARQTFDRIRKSRGPFLKMHQAQYVKLTRLVEDLQTGSVTAEKLEGDIIKIPKELGLRESLTEGRMIRLTGNSDKPKSIAFLVSGLFNGGEKILSRDGFIKEMLSQGTDVIYFEMTQGYTAAREIINNKGESPRRIEHKEQQTLLAFYILKAIEQYNLDKDTPKVLIGHSYGGWLANRFISNPEYNGAKEIENPFLNKMGQILHAQGLVSEKPMDHLINTLVPLDAGLGSLHLLHPMLANISAMTGARFWTPMQTHGDISIAQIMRSGLLTAHPQLEKDPLSLDNAIALFVGIRNENMLNAPSEIPQHIKIFDVVAGESELIPSSWHRYYATDLASTSQGAHHRSTIIIEGAPHDFLPVEGVGTVVGRLATNSFEHADIVTSIKFENPQVRVKGFSKFPGNTRTDVGNMILQMQVSAFQKYIDTVMGQILGAHEAYAGAMEKSLAKWETGESSAHPEGNISLKTWRSFFPKIWRKLFHDEKASSS